jgi:hypothetical protein
VPLPLSRTPEVLAAPVELALGAGGAGLTTTLGTGAATGLGTALRPVSPAAPASGSAFGGGSRGGSSTSTVKVDRTACSADAMASGANAFASA